MASPRSVKVLQSQLSKAAAAPHPHLAFAVLDGDIGVWYVRARGLEAPFTGGEYLFKLTAPKDFPARPPALEFLTPSGVFVEGTQHVCISIGEFHARDFRATADADYGWRPALGMVGFAEGVLSAMRFFDRSTHGVGVAVKDAEEKAALAATSRAFNAAHFPRIVALFAAS
jgi:ubiquitin-conjugating enzyme E2 J2